MNGLSSETQQRVLDHMAAHLKVVTPEDLRQPGTTIHVSERRERDGSQLLWQVGAHKVVSTHADYVDVFQQAKAHPEANVALTVSDVARVYSDFDLRETDKFLTVDAGCFVDHPAPTGIDIRQVGPEDEAAFQAFVAASPAAEQNEAEVSLTDEIAYGAFDGSRLVTMASTYEYMGMIDIGVLTDPAYRGRGLGRAVVAAVSRHYLNDPHENRLLLYRHVAKNIGSSKVAGALGYQLFSQIDYLRFRAGT